jgi:L-aminopeptidase/D-esterase-like protein
MSGDAIDRRRFLTGVAAGGAVSVLTARAAGSEEVEDPKDEPAAHNSPALVPRVEFRGRALRFDFASLRIGVAEYDEGPTGCTVFHFADGARCAEDVRGGSPGTFMGGDGPLDALCFAGGSSYGLEAASGVAAELFSRRGFARRFDEIATVRGAIIFDFAARATAIYPDKALGQAALKAARPGVFLLGRRGAGRSATVGKAFDFPRQLETGGQGGAFRQVGPTKVAVFTVVNAVGAIVDRAGRVVRGNRDHERDRRLPALENLEHHLNARAPAPAPATPGNTTLTAVVTNQRFDPWALTMLARQVHSAMARAIQPFHSWNDGDVLYAVTTAEVENPALDTTMLGILASELAWDAVLNCYQD